ncbi:MAG: PD-(D/E)XK nuclease-like domain-containing protein, partial [Ruminococcus sp.]|nr:PD-(D/E)XK nuclease-like domain-containing protein [Ruminococcus sp.]
FKIKIDSYLDGICITDLKCIKDLKPVWDEDARQRKHFINYWGYDIQGAIYREIVRQNTGKLLPFYIAAITKEKPEPRLKVYWLPDEDLDHALGEVQSLAPRFQQIKGGKLQPQRCGKCNYCRYTEILTEPINYHEEMEAYEVE